MLRLASALFLCLVALAGCGSGPNDPPLPVLELVQAGGEGQFGTPGSTLGEPLRAVVQRSGDARPEAGVVVLWSITEGDGVLIGSAATVSDSTGTVTIRLRFGSATGPVVVRATTQEQETAFTEFHAFSVDAPALSSVTPTTAAPGDTVTLSGANFSPVANQSVVRFSGIRGRVLESSSTTMRVIVPPCLPPRAVGVTVRLGVVASDSVALVVQGDAPTLALSPGEVVDLSDDMTCHRLPGGGGERYLAVLQSTSTVGAAEYPLSFVSLAYDAAVPSGIPGPEPDLPERLGEWSGDVDGPGTAHFLWEEGVRASEAAILRTRSAETGVGPAVRAPTGPAAVPQVGEKRIFKVYRSDGTFADVTAEALYVGARAAIFVDQAAPAGGFTSADLAFLSGQFDDLIGPTVTDVFGAESDLDGNARVVILLTPEVNRLTARGSDGFVGGFFYGLDLLADQENSNGGEIFYTLVPDPDGSFSDPRSRAQILMVVPAVLAHEFQHMVHFNQRILQLKAENAEALWLSEALAQMAEELVARADVSGSYVESYRRGNRVRARRYLAAPASASLIVNTGQGSLEERGAGWLHVLYASAQGDAPVVLRDLTRTTRTGVANIEAVAGRRWADLLGDWWSALYLDGTALPVGTELGFPGVDLQSVLTSPGDPGFPLVPAPVGGSDFLLESAFLSASAAFYLVAPPGAGTASVALGGGTAGVLRAEVGARLRIIRVR